MVVRNITMPWAGPAEPMCWHFIQQACQDSDCAVSRIHPLALELLLSYPWPGNVRELRNVIERAVVISRDGEITVEDLPAPIRSQSPPEPTTDPFLEVTDRDLPCCVDSKNLKSELRQKEALIIQEMLNRHNWNRKQAAEALGMQRMGDQDRPEMGSACGGVISRGG